MQSPCSFTAADSDEESEIDISECKPNHNTTNEPPVLPEIPEDISGEYSTLTLPRHVLNSFRVLCAAYVSTTHVHA
jgi:hypothetical protein